MRQKVFLLLTLLCTWCFSAAQQVTVTGGFAHDSIAIGQPIGYYLTARYPENLTVLFPDSTFTFPPFEYISRRYFPTQTQHGISYDSVVYQFRTFELDPVQKLSLAVFIPGAADSLWFACKPDSVHLIRQVNVFPPDTLPVTQLPLKTNTEYRFVRFLFNYPVVAIAAGSLLLAAVLGWIFFGKRIKKYFRIRQLQKDYKSFTRDFSDYISQLSTQFNPLVAEQSLALWKRYLEKLEQKPYTKLTTREMLTLETDTGALGPALKALDGAIYGHLKNVHEPLDSLGKIAEQRYHKKLNEVKHG
jgi:hypothetical protein